MWPFKKKVKFEQAAATMTSITFSNLNSIEAIRVINKTFESTRSLGFQSNLGIDKIRKEIFYVVCFMEAQPVRNIWGENEYLRTLNGIIHHIDKVIGRDEAKMFKWAFEEYEKARQEELKGQGVFEPYERVNAEFLYQLDLPSLPLLSTLIGGLLASCCTANWRLVATKYKLV